MKRRDFMTLLAGAVAGFPRPASSTSRPRLVGVLMGVDGADAAAQARVAAFRAALAELGWTEGRNIRIDVRWASGDPQRMRTEAAALVGEAPDAILTSGTPAIAALRDATTTIPIVFVTYGDPVARGWVTSLAQPGGNITGLAISSPRSAANGSSCCARSLRTSGASRLSPIRRRRPPYCS